MQNVTRKTPEEGEDGGIGQILSGRESASGRASINPPGTETPVNPGNKEMIKSDSMSRRRRQATTRIRRGETDVPAPPSDSSPLTHSLTHTQQSLVHSLHSPTSEAHIRQELLAPCHRTCNTVRGRAGLSFDYLRVKRNKQENVDVREARLRLCRPSPPPILRYGSRGLTEAVCTTAILLTEFPFSLQAHRTRT